MLWIIAVILFALWLLSRFFALGGFIQILLLLALAGVFIRMIQVQKTNRRIAGKTFTLWKFRSM